MSERAGEGRITTGSLIAAHELVTITGERIGVPDAGRLVHLQFRRFAGCPVCNLHMRSIAQRHDEIAAAEISEIVVFHSTAEDLLVHAAELPFAVIADPDKRLYVEFGVESAPRALLDPRAWMPLVRGFSHDLWKIIRRRQAAPSLNPEGGSIGLPADFLIAADGHVVACKYGEHGYDQWSVDELLELARTEKSRPRYRENAR
ncbi:peroxiredoxin-like family protein [Actinoallomurus iriomotensis]|uniref:Alkyl hydroperoxide reductase n=1 Tax=Actinoallomurus iriomotensis TaxID=478107 RepID=A0A9W6RKD2_9ACTN|nr:peroxiredoxin-like family protein [Actinoallomurus iriomotensis]GLY75475.1 alkyl hydroperoxide reductase [Actinoallomurus iriomotensis]